MNETVDPALTAGTFRALTGLSAKALRLYGERGLLAPVDVDPDSGYRTFALGQLRDGMRMDFLRRAHVPLAALDGDEPFSVAEWRSSLTLRRSIEDFYLDLAEHVAQRDLDDFQPTLVDAPAAHWVAVSVELSTPDDPDDALEAFGALALDVPALDAIVVDALEEAGCELEPECWTEAAGGEADARMRIAHRLRAPLTATQRDACERAIAERAPATAQLSSGRLPHRTEVTFSASEHGDGVVAEAGDAYLQIVAFARFAAERSVEPLRWLPRARVRSRSLFEAAPVDVFDLRRPSA